jgi:hypothetical protein
MNTEDNKEEFQFWNDEWNTSNTKQKYFLYMSEEKKEWLDEQIKEFIKNDKPDGRRYKK